MPAQPEHSNVPDLSSSQLRRILEDPDFFQAIFDAFPLQVVVKSARPKTFGQILRWNRVAVEWTGWGFDEVVGRTDHEIFPREQADVSVAGDREVMLSRRPIETPEEILHARDGRVRHLRTVKTPIFDEAGEPLALLACSEDMTGRKRALDERDEALRRMREERNLFRELLDHLPVGVFARSARTEDFGVHVFWNRRMQEFHGKTPEEALGRTAEQIFGGELGGIFTKQDEDLIERGVELVVPLQSHDDGAGRQKLTHAIKVPIFDEEGRPAAIVGVLEDITGRVEREAEGAQALDTLRQLNSRVPGAIYRMRVAPDGERSFTYMSERIEEIYQIPAAEFLADFSVSQDCIFPRDRPKVAQAEVAAREAGTFFNCEFRIHARGGGMRWVHSSASCQATGDGGSMWFGFVTDVTERKCAEEKLQESQQRWELALASTEAGVWDWNIRTGEMFFSERWRQMFGWASDQLPATPRALLELVNRDDRQLVRDSTRAILKRRADLFRCEYRMRRGDGTEVWILAHAKAHFDERGMATRMIGTLIDITERKRVEAQLVEAKVAAENASRAKGDFLAMMSHEIRTPLNGVLGFAELLSTTPLELPQIEYLQTIRESGSNLLHVLNDILDYSKIESGKLAIDYQPADLRNLVESAVTTFEAKARAKQLELVCAVAADVPGNVLVDAMRVRQVLTNLISNAVKFTENGAVRVSVERMKAAGTGGIVPLRFSVADQGIGIAAEDLKRLFEPFEQLDVSMARRFGGTGLGLSIVHRLVSLMGGTIRATSAPGAGTTFVVDLPLEESRPADESIAAETPKRAETKPLAVLIVDDHPVNRRLARLMLQRIGYEPDEAADGPSAVERASRRNYDVILMDIQMPGMDGYEAARRIRRFSPWSQVIALTAHAMPADRRRSSEAGMHAHLTKPVRVDELREILAACAARTSKSPSDD
jgi:PAS domain S-box-containing protein